MDIQKSNAAQIIEDAPGETRHEKICNAIRKIGEMPIPFTIVMTITNTLMVAELDRLGYTKVADEFIRITQAHRQRITDTMDFSRPWEGNYENV